MALVGAETVHQEAENTMRFMKSTGHEDPTILRAIDSMKAILVRNGGTVRSLKRRIAYLDAHHRVNSTTTLEGLAKLGRDAYEAYRAEEERIRATTFKSHTDEDADTWDIPEEFQTQNYIYFDRLAKDAHTRLMCRLRDICKDAGKGLQLSTDSRVCTIELTRTNGKSLTLYFSAGDVQWAGHRTIPNKSIGAVQKLISESDYPAEFKEFVNSCISSFYPLTE